MAEIVRMSSRLQPSSFYKDGRKEKFSPSDIALIEFGNSSASEMAPGRGHFVGKWEVGQGQRRHFLHHPRRRRRGEEEYRRLAWDLEPGRWRGSDQLGRWLARRDQEGGHQARELAYEPGKILRRRTFQTDRCKKHAAQTDLEPI